MKKVWVNLSVVVLALGIIAVAYYVWHVNQQGGALRQLPIFNPIAAELQNNIAPNDNHKVKDFKVVNQYGDTITRKDFSGKITVVDFFFTTCQGICPKMTNQMDRVMVKYRKDDRVLLLSHTVNPENDSVSVLRAYAEKHIKEKGKWHFVTGDKAHLYDLARTSYLLSDTRGDGGKEDFVHSNNFALVDHNGYIRGMYDGTDPKDVDRLLAEMDVLLAELK